MVRSKISFSLVYGSLYLVKSSSFICRNTIFLSTTLIRPKPMIVVPGSMPSMIFSLDKKGSLWVYRFMRFTGLSGCRPLLLIVTQWVSGTSHLRECPVSMQVLSSEGCSGFFQSGYENLGLVGLSVRRF